MLEETSARLDTTEAVEFRHDTSGWCLFEGRQGLVVAFSPCEKAGGRAEAAVYYCKNSHQTIIGGSVGGSGRDVYTDGVLCANNTMLDSFTFSLI